MTSLRVLVLAALLFTSPAFASDEDPALSRAAYAALLKADGLADVNIGVRVFKDGSAMLWGSARPADAAKAEAVLKKVPGITSVMNTCDPTTADAKAPSPKLPELPPLGPSPPVATPTTTEKRTVEPAARLLDPLPAPGLIDYAAIDRLRRSDPRYARLTFDLRDGRIVIGGKSSDPRAAWDLAREIEPLVGNRDVVVHQR
jgi:hypothetical protein